MVMNPKVQAETFQDYVSLDQIFFEPLPDVDCPSDEVPMVPSPSFSLPLAAPVTPVALMGERLGPTPLEPMAKLMEHPEQPAAPQVSADDARSPAVRPSINPPEVYSLYRGFTGTFGTLNEQSCRIWVEFSTGELGELCWAWRDLPARSSSRISLLHLSGCRCDLSSKARLDIHYAVPTAMKRGRGGCLEGDGERRQVLQVFGGAQALQEFSEALSSLIKSRDEEGKTVLEFIRRRLFQYLWVRQGCLRSEEGLLEAQAVLAFNLDPKDGVQYLREKLGKSTDAEVGEWLAVMSFNKGGIDPTLLGNYFSRLDTIEVTKTFIAKLSFDGLDIVCALRRLFDTFKPGGESQVITRILEFFAETYLRQWESRRHEVLPLVHYGSSDSVLQVAVSLIMLNTGLHVLPKKTAKKRFSKKHASAVMTVEEYIRNTSSCVSLEEVPEQALRIWYEVVRETAISVEPMPRVPFSTLPVQPDIEGWLIAVLAPRVRRRFWAVLALQRLYLFSDRSEDIEPSDTLDLKDFTVCCIARDRPARERLRKEQGGLWLGGCLAAKPEDLPEMPFRSFELCRREPAQAARPEAARPSTTSVQRTMSSRSEGAAVQMKKGKLRTSLVMVAETPDFMERWVNLISAGAYL